MEVSKFLTKCVWGMGMLKFIMTQSNKTRETLYIREYLCVFTKLFTGTRLSEDLQFWLISGSLEICENAQPCADFLL